MTQNIPANGYPTHPSHPPPPTQQKKKKKKKKPLFPQTPKTSKSQNSKPPKIVLAYWQAKFRVTPSPGVLRICLFIYSI